MSDSVAPFIPDEAALTESDLTTLVDMVRVIIEHRDRQDLKLLSLLTTQQKCQLWARVSEGDRRLLKEIAMEGGDA